MSSSLTRIATIRRAGRGVPSILMIFFLTVGPIFAQQGASSGAAARVRTLSEGNSSSASPSSYGASGYSAAQPASAFPASREVAVEEFVNYRRHRLPLPAAGDSVAMEARWGNDAVSASQPEAVLQIGLATAEAYDNAELPPLSLTLVIDRSGSMAANDKLARVKDALLAMIGQLRESDSIAIVTFDGEASVLFPAQRLGNRHAVAKAIQSVQPGGSTNLHGGLMLGYQEALKNSRSNSTNRVILLTDGIANVGVSDPRRIAQESAEYNAFGIDLSTIGVGLELDQDLLRTLAKAGHGLFHFVADSRDIEKVFVGEVQSLIAPVARNATLEIEYAPELALTKVYGYEPNYGANKISVRLDDMNQGLTEVVLIKFQLRGRNAEKRYLPVQIRLSYYDIQQRKERIESVNFSLVSQGRHAGHTGDPLQDGEVRKNFTIAALAQSIRDMASACETNQYGQAESILNAALTQTQGRYPNLRDQDILYVFNIARRYQDALRSRNEGGRRGQGW